MKTITLNCDIGESYGIWTLGNDEQLMPLIDSANIACGFHAGDPTIIRKTLQLTKQHRVEVGAQVSYPDLQGFGRRSINLRGDELVDILQYQIAALDGMARIHGRRLTYVKPHGALYNDMMADKELLKDVMRAVAGWPRNIDLVVLATPRDKKVVQLGIEYGVSLRFEAFADRGYHRDGTLVSRGKPGAVLDQEAAVAQAVAIAKGELRSQSGRKVSLRPDTLCVHGDTPNAVEILTAIRTALSQLGA